MTVGANGFVVLDTRTAVAEGAGSGNIREIADGIGLANEYITSSRTVSTSVGQRSSMALAACVGVNCYISHWYGCELRLSSCNAQVLLSALLLGATAAGLVGTIFALHVIRVTAAIALYMATGLLGIGAAAVTYCARESNGVKLYQELDSWLLVHHSMKLIPLSQISRRSRLLMALSGISIVLIWWLLITKSELEPRTTVTILSTLLLVASSISAEASMIAERDRMNKRE